MTRSRVAARHRGRAGHGLLKGRLGGGTALLGGGGGAGRCAVAGACRFSAPRAGQLAEGIRSVGASLPRSAPGGAGLARLGSVPRGPPRGPGGCRPASAAG